MPITSRSEQPFNVAIIGAGIAGLTLALGLLNRRIVVTVYERAPDYHETGAGIGFTSNAEWAMKTLDPRIYDTFKEVATQNEEDWFRWVDGYSHDKSDMLNTHEELMFQLYLGQRGFEGCQRSGFMEGLARYVPKRCVQFNRDLETIVDPGGGRKVVCKFRDGTSAEADMVIGCDGIRSRVRQLLLGANNPAAYPHYTHKYALRGLVPMEQARSALGKEQTSNRIMHLGPNAHVLTFPVAMDQLLNVVSFVTDPNDWPHARLSAPADKSAVLETFAEFGPGVRTIMGLLPEQLDAWAVFDMFDHPAPSYVKDRVCLSGDAAHACAPHHGAGAGFGIEDAVVLAEVVARAAEEAVGSSGLDKEELVQRALWTYNNVRYERTQWLVHSSRLIGELFEWQDEGAGRDPGKCEQEVYWRSHQIWDYDIEAMVKHTRAEFQRAVSCKGGWKDGQITDKEWWFGCTENSTAEID